MIERLLDRLFSKRTVINCDHDPYLHRWYVIRTRAFALFIHKFIRSDEDRALHDHPWSFVVIPIWRGYYEHSESIPEEYTEKACFEHGVDRERLTKRRRIRPLLGTRFRRGTYRHRVELLKSGERTLRALRPDPRVGRFFSQSPYMQTLEPVELPSWSIFIRFREFREWGFWEKGGFIESSNWWQQNCE